jgi:hypothetical protein
MQNAESKPLAHARLPSALLSDSCALRRYSGAAMLFLFFLHVQYISRDWLCQSLRFDVAHFPPHNPARHLEAGVACAPNRSALGTGSVLNCRHTCPARVVTDVSENLPTYISRLGRYWIASARCAVSIESLPARSAIVLASFRIR